MKLEEKGPIQPAPLLKGPSQKTAESIQSWPAIRSATHWQLGNRTRVDGADFYVNQEELGHIHLDGEVHLATTSELGIALLNQNLVSPAPFGRNYGDWVIFRIATDVDADHSIWLFRINYDRIQGEPMNALAERIRVYQR